MTIKVPIAIKGGAGSGNFGHSGRPGLVGGSSTGGESNYTVSTNSNGVKMKDLQDWGKDRRSYAKFVYAEIIRIDSTPIIIRDGDEVVALSTLNTDTLTADVPFVEVNNLVSKRSGSGYGVTCLVEACKIASQHGKGLRLDSSVGARTFYEKIGMHLAEGWANRYEFTSEEVNDFLSRVS